MFQTQTNEHLIRSNLWSRELKEVLEFELMGMRYVRMLSDFPDGDTINIPSIGQAVAQDYVEGNPIKFTSMDTGNFTFSVTEYKQSGHYITEKMKQQSYYMSQLVSSFVPREHRAIMTAMETDLLETGPDGQTTSDLNEVNGAKHRFVASGTNQVMTVEDFATAKHSLRKAAVPMTNLVAIVDSSVAWEFETTPNIANVSTNPHWEGIITSGMTTGMSFVRNIYGFDVYTSEFLKSSMSETIDSVAVTNGVANLFFSAASDVLPFVGLLRQAPKVDSQYNMTYQREEYATTARYGFKLYRPENLVVILSDNSRVG